MLVLSRKPGNGVGSSIMIGDGVVVTVLRRKGNQVVLGIQAPEDVLVLRDELCKRAAEREAAPEGS